MVRRQGPWCFEVDSMLMIGLVHSLLSHGELVALLERAQANKPSADTPAVTPISSRPKRKSPERKKAERKAETASRTAAVVIRELREKMATEDDGEGPEEEIDLKYMNSIIRKSGIVVSAQLIEKAMREFKVLVPNRTGLDINQFDIVMTNIGFTCPYDRHRLFRAFDFDFNNTVEYCEFIWGIAMLFNGSLAQKFDQLWQKLDTKGSGFLQEGQLYKMLVSGGNIKDEKLLRLVTERIFQRLDKDMNGSLDYEEFQLGLLEDKVVAHVFHKCVSGSFTEDDIADLISDVAANKKVATAVRPVM